MAMFDADGKQDNAIAKVIAGMELGVGPMASIRGFHMIKGKPSLSGELVATLIKRSGRYDFRSKVEADRATVTIYDRGEALDPVTFTMDDAKTAGLTGNENYKKYGPDMLFNRAVVRAARRHCPEVIGGAVYLESDEAEAQLAGEDEAPSAPEQPHADVDSTATEPEPFDPVRVAQERYDEIRGLALERDFDAERMAKVWAAAEIEAQADLADDVKYERAKAALAAPEGPPQEETLPGMGAPTGEDPHS